MTSAERVGDLAEMVSKDGAPALVGYEDRLLAVLRWAASVLSAVEAAPETPAELARRLCRAGDTCHPKVVAAITREREIAAARSLAREAGLREALRADEECLRFYAHPTSMGTDGSLARARLDRLAALNAPSGAASPAPSADLAAEVLWAVGEALANAEYGDPHGDPGSADSRRLRTLKEKLLSGKAAPSAEALLPAALEWQDEAVHVADPELDSFTECTAELGGMELKIYDLPTRADWIVSGSLRGAGFSDETTLPKAKALTERIARAALQPKATPPSAAAQTETEKP